MRSEKIHPRFVLLTSFVLLLSGLPEETRANPPAWDFQGTVADGLQFDVVRGPSDVLHLVSSRYYQYDDQGAQLVVEDQGDGRQNPLDFAPAIAVGDDGTVHLVTRHGGELNTGHDIRYRRRTAAGVWDVSYIFGSQVPRNYVVGVAWSDGHVYLAHSDTSANFWGVIHLFEELGGSASALGDLQGIWRADADIRMRGAGGQVHLASGMPDPGLGGRVYYLWGNAGANLLSELTANQVQHNAGAERKGGPELYLDGNDAVHFTYGAEFAVYYNQYLATGPKVLSSDAVVMTGLGLWQMKYGVSTMASADSGDIVVVVALRSNSSDPDSCGEDSSLLWSYSMDGGQSFSAPVDMGHTSNGGCGRLRPRLTAIGQKFFLFYKDNNLSGISLATLEFESTDFSDFSPAGEVADDTPDCSVRVRNEFTGLDVSSAECEYSTNGGVDWTSWPATCTGADGTNALETISSAGVPFLQESSTQNQIRFRITSVGGLVTVSEAVPVSIVAPVVPPDAGTAEEDATVAGDGGSPDAGEGSDGGEDPNGPGVSGGCSCLHLGADNHAPAPSYPLLLLILVGLWVVRRRIRP